LKYYEFIDIHTPLEAAPWGLEEDLSELTRLSMSIEKSLAKRLDDLAAEAQYANRSEFLRDLVRHAAVERQWKANEEVLGTLTILYDHHQRGLTEKLTTIQHDHGGEILAATHLHLSHHLCAEMIMVRGKAGDVKLFSDSMKKLKGVLHAALSMSSTGHGVR
jgi:CopG family nickel-responsive transcriptional regulator